MILLVLDVVSEMREGKGRCTQTRKEFRSERMDAICIVTVVHMDLGEQSQDGFSI